MSKNYTLKDCFEFFDTRARNTRTSTSARSDDGNTVAIQLWKDKLVYKKGQATYRDDGIDDDVSGDRAGFAERLENLIWVRDHCDGFFKSIILTPEKTDDEVRTMRDCFPHAKLNMQLTDLNEETGEFQAQNVAEK